jgi:hypothetical protein
VRARYRPRRGDQRRRPAGAPRGCEVVHASALGAHAGQQERRPGHAGPQAIQPLGRGGADDRAHVGEPAVPHALGPELVDHSGEPLGQRVPVGEPCVLELGRSRVRCAHEDEGPAAVDQRREGVAAEERVGGDGVGAERVVERVGVGLRGDGDVAALGVEEDQEALGAGRVDDGTGGFEAAGADALEAGELELCGDALRSGGVDQRTALGLDARRGSRVCRLDFGPDPGGIRIESEDDLGGALPDRRCETIGEALRQARAFRFSRA